MFKMEDVEMDISEPAEELQPDATDLVFKTPMHVNHSKHFSAPMSEDSGNSSAFSPELLNSTSGSLYLGIQKTTRKLKRESLFLTPDSRSSDSQLSIGSECSSVNGNLLGVIEGSPDSGLDCESFCSSVRDFVVHDPDEDSIISHHIPCISDCDTKQHLAAPANFVSPKKVGRIPTGSVTFESVRKVWQSTPANADIKITRPTFGTPLECPDLKQSPTKRRRVSSRKASRDLFQSRRKVPTAFQRPFLGDYPTIQSLMQTSFVGRETVDFLSYLGKHSVLQPAMDIILGSLEPADLCRACLVSRSWKNVIESDPTALQRKRDYVDLRNQIKENLHLFSKKSESGDVLPIRGTLMAIQNLNKTVDVPSPGTGSPPVSPSKVRFNLFMKEARKLENGQTLVQCPNCKLPSRKETENSARCTRRGCQYYFCILCLCKFHSDKPCPVSVKHRKRQAAIGSRESRRNLQRLCK